MQQCPSQPLESRQSRSVATHCKRLEAGSLFSFRAATFHQPPRQYALSFSITLNRYPHLVGTKSLPSDVEPRLQPDGQAQVSQGPGVHGPGHGCS